MLGPILKRLVFCLILFNSYRFCGSAKSLFANLIKDLFENYDPGVRPVTALEQTVQVGVNFGIIQLLNVVSLLFFYSAKVSFSLNVYNNVLGR